MIGYYFYDIRNIRKNFIYLVLSICFNCYLLIQSNGVDINWTISMLLWITISLPMTIKLDEISNLEKTNKVAEKVLIYKTNYYLAAQIIAFILINAISIFVISFISIILINTYILDLQILHLIFSNHFTTFKIIKAFIYLPFITMCTFTIYMKINFSSYIRNILRVLVNFLYLGILLTQNYIILLVMLIILIMVTFAIVKKLDKIVTS